jgi:hypothetical protein
VFPEEPIFVRQEGFSPTLILKLYQACGILSVADITVGLIITSSLQIYLIPRVRLYTECP